MQSGGIINMKVKILILDIETAPAKVYAWGIYDQNITHKQIIEDNYMMCWTAKWYHSKEVFFDSIVNYPDLFKKEPRNDSRICESIWHLMNEADICIAHHGDAFDFKKLNSFFLKNNMKPTSPFKTVDTKKALKTYFGFISNKLDAICKELELGTKLEHEGFDLWIKCMRGDAKAWDKMRRYNINDVKLLEKLYDKIKPYIANHPNLSLYEDNLKIMCKKCLSINFIKRGFVYTSSCKYQRYVCSNCGSWFRDSRNLLTRKEVSK